MNSSRAVTCLSESVEQRSAASSPSSAHTYQAAYVRTTHERRRGCVLTRAPCAPVIVHEVVDVGEELVKAIEARVVIVRFCRSPAGWR